MAPSKLRRQVRDRRRADGLPAPHKVRDRKNFPADVTEIHDEELARLMDYFSQQVARANYLVAQYQIDVMHYEELISLVTAKYRNGSDAKAKWKAEAELSENGRFKQYTNKKNMAQANLINSKALRDGYDHRYNALSRELTRRLSSREHRNITP